MSQRVYRVADLLARPPMNPIRGVGGGPIIPVEEEDSERPHPSIRAEILQRDAHRCRYCGAEATHIDHIVPYAFGGPNTEENLVACCARCNCLERGETFPSWTAKRDAVRARL